MWDFFKKFNLDRESKQEVRKDELLNYILFEISSK